MYFIRSYSGPLETELNMYDLIVGCPNQTQEEKNPSLSIDGINLESFAVDQPTRSGI